MGLRLSILVIFLGLVWAAGAVSYPADSRCRQCHPPHWVDGARCIHCHRGDPRTDRVEIAHRGLIPARYSYFRLPKSRIVEEGRQLIKEFGCRRCHRTGGRGNELAAKLDGVLPAVKPESLATAIKDPVPFMPNFYFEDVAVTRLVNAILAGAAAEPESGDIPVVIHFGHEKQPRENVFGKRCGDCHRVLTRRVGALGRGDIGPNLSGLLTSFYPHKFKESKPWTSETLKDWLGNPREIRVNARMLPVNLAGDEFSRLVQLFQGGTEGKDASRHQERIGL